MKKTFQLLVICLVVSTTAMAQQTSKFQIKELTAKEFKQKVWNFEKDKSINRLSKLPVILDFHATWCRPCKMLSLIHI